MISNPLISAFDSIEMALKWIFDRLFSFLGLLLLSWLFLIVAILVKVRMSGPVFFTQERIGRGGKPFNIHKFRTMTERRETDVITGVAAIESSRITPLGEKLRKYKLDELPELWDVFIGKMSFVGPRPDIPGYADHLQGEDREILSLRPGITGPATLKYRNEEELLASVDDPQKYNDEVIYPDKVRLNLYYLHHYSFMMDLRMMLATVSGRHIEYAGEMI